MTGLLASTGVWLEDEIQKSGDPAAHADGIIATMLRERIGWVVTNAAIPGASAALTMLHQASQRHGYGAAGYWTQNYPPHMANPREYLRSGELDGAQVMIANLESREEDDRWTNANVDELADLWPDYHAGVCYTEAAWGKHPDGSYRKDLSARWNDGIVSMPEAIQSENPAASIPAMAHVNQQFGFHGDITSYALYLTRGYPAINYDPYITVTGGRWSIFRYGDIGESDWEVLANWPRPTAPDPQPEPEPHMPRGAAKSAYDAMDYWMNSTAKPADWRTQNPGEWQKVQDYRAAAPGAPAPVVNSKTGLMLVSILESAKWAEGNHE